jgi:hypothetical protein
MQTTQNASDHSRLVERLPVTFRPFINEKLRDMGALFAFERESLETLLSFLEGLDQSEFELLFRQVRAVETKMGVERWTFSMQGETLENTSLLAHSAYYQEWRQAVQEVFDEVSQRAHSSADQLAGRAKHRFILIVLPKCLPVRMETVWNNWHGQGRLLTLAATDSSIASCSEILLGGNGASLLRILANTGSPTAEDTWILDAGSTLSEAFAVQNSSEGILASSTYLSYAELKTFRETFRDRLNWVQKDLADADKVIAALRQTDVTPWCPDALKNRIATREFVKDLFLSGNGSVVFGNAFVQWAANEAFRRARPRMLVACFGMRNKPKPFTSIAILEDQEHSSPLPDTADPDGSAVDAQILAYYVWLAASRYEEYKDALCLCVADAQPAIYAIAPAEHSLFREKEPMTVERVRQIVEEWMS